MCHKYLNLLIICCLLLSCADSSESNAGAKEEVSASSSPMACYSYTAGKDTIILKTVDVKGFITGVLLYKLYQKDRNAGTIQGRMKNDMLIADYTFMSEGVTSVRQVAFKKVGHTFIEGYGKVTAMQNEKSVFVNPDSLNFNNAMALKKVDCEK
ncbi:MAG: hypothetical protein ABIQ88_03160 [Chitinophagaceae bacterium]